MKFMQVRDLIWRKKRPFFIFEHSLHEQVWYPVGRVHVMGTTSVITRVFAKFKKFFYIKMPGFQIGTNCAFAFAALVNRHRGIVDHFQKGNNAL